MRAFAFLSGSLLVLCSQVSLAAATVSPASQSWASVAIGNKGGQKVITLTNGNTASITISGITFSGANAGDFSVYSKTCGSALAAGASCTANILFGPTATGTRTATLNFNDSDGSSPQTVALTGLGSGGVAASPTSLTFSSTSVGSTSASLAATLKNGLGTAISVSNVTITGTNAADFAISASTCGTSLSASASCSASVVFKPTAAGTRSAILSFTDSASNSPQSVALTGTGTATSSTATVSPASLTFASTAVASSTAAQAVTLSNGPGASISISSIVMSGANSSDFAVSGTNCGSALSASASCSATVVFTPTAAGARTATLTFTDTATNSPQSVALTGTGASATGNTTVSPKSVSWATVAIGNKGGQKVVTLTNGNASPLTISSLTFSGVNPGDFSIFSKTCGASLAASASCTVNLLFGPTASGPRTATFNFNDSDGSSPQTVALTGAGTGGVAASPTSLAFPGTTMGANSPTQSVTLTNGLTTSITIGSIAIGGANPTDFAVGSTTCGSSLPASGACTATIVFYPSAAGTRTATLSFGDSAGNSPQNVALSGVGNASMTISPTSANLTEGDSKQFTANANATWSASCGSVSSSGLYVAPLVATTCTVIATPTAGGAAASASVTVASPLLITPQTASTPQNATQQFTANMSVSWASSCGSISGSGLFTASGSTGVCTISATASSGTAFTGTASDTIINQTVLQITPANPSLTEGQDQQFSSGAPATWSASCGSITSSGVFTAPLNEGSCTITATATDGSGNTANTLATVTSPITITPSSVNLHALNTQSFNASQSVSWSSSCGSITGAGLFTAPASAGTCTITGTASSGPAYTASTSVTVDMVNHVRWRNSTGGTGLQSSELALTPANVNSTTFGQAWSFAVDGGVWAQPLYMNALTINGTAHNVLFVGTDNDTMYALDADTGTQLWSTSLIPAGGSAVAGTMVDDPYIPYIGILGTPAIDNGTLYVVAETAEQNATVFPHRLHALDIATGQEKLGGPVLISDPNLPAAHKLQRTGLTVANGSVYVSFGSLADKAPYHGFVFAFDNSTLAQQAVWNSTPTGSAGGIWMGGGSPSVDSSGNIYVLTGNGSADGVNNFGESAIELSPSLQRLSFFTPYNAASLTASDLDLGAASVPVMPDVNGQFPHELIFCGKSPAIYVVNRDSMGGFNTTADNVIQKLSGAVGGTATSRGAGTACYTSPSAWGANIYFIANGDVLKQFTLDPSSGLLSTSPVHQGSFGYGWPGSQSMISSNGSTNGIIWSFDQAGKTLRADNASDVSANLFVSAAIATGYVKWVAPIVINGHVYIGGQGTVVAFSLK